MASKLNKACREIPGSTADAWRGVSAEMESRGEVHRMFSTSMVEEIVKPLKNLLENQHKTRKAVSRRIKKTKKKRSRFINIKIRRIRLKVPSINRLESCPNGVPAKPKPRKPHTLRPVKTRNYRTPCWMFGSFKFLTFSSLR